MADMKFSVSARREGPALVRVQARNFSMYVDEPANLGGSDKGANPVEYLLGALAGCLNVVANLVANEMNIELRGMTIEAEGDLNPGRFSGKSMEERAGFKQIRVTLNPDLQADEATKRKWLETIEQRCPLNDNLTNPTPVKITLA
ncbi:MAG: OsmC family protein [Clostridiales bacterium]|jgi:uncharacterized OsmC-like protein|nr:OsmC family protein [Clostridiales bacterium]